MNGVTRSSSQRPLVIFSRTLNLAGAEGQVAMLGMCMHAKGIPVIVVTLQPGGPRQADIDRAGVRSLCLNKTSRFGLPLAIIRLLFFLRSVRPHTLYSFLAVPNLIALSLRPFVPDMRVIWGIRSSQMELNQYDWTARITYKTETRLSARPDMIISNSYAGRSDAVARGFPDSDSFLVVSNGVYTDRFQPNPESRDELRRAWGLVPDDIAIGTVGRYDPKKGHKVLFAAAAELVTRHPRLRFVLVGGDTAARTQELHELAKKLGLNDQLVWVGPQKDMPAVYNALDLLCLPSAYGEGFPNVVGEAMSCGLPCVVTDVGDAARIVGNTGVIVPPGDPEKLAAGIANLLGADLEQCSMLARERIKNHFSSDLLLSNTCAAIGLESLS